MVLLTVIGKRLAKPGVTFTYMGVLSNCKECKVKTICFHLEEGKRFRIVGTRDVVHECPVHDEGVLVVEVEEMPVDATLPAKQALEGSTVTIELPKCSVRGCQNHGLCFPVGLSSGQKKNVAKVEKPVECLAGHKLVRVSIE